MIGTRAAVEAAHRLHMKEQERARMRELREGFSVEALLDALREQFGPATAVVSDRRGSAVGGPVVIAAGGCGARILVRTLARYDDEADRRLFACAALLAASGRGDSASALALYLLAALRTSRAHVVYSVGYEQCGEARVMGRRDLAEVARHLAWTYPGRGAASESASVIEHSGAAA
jgi:hypothetical protein